ncbi:hypothetical protein P0W64_17475 [Tsukamurella sp. 8F]|uniref:hypothetical protein n=1 Tax=unclassified Tsukamurella TaxID=2633480 RepID=UPI0023B9E1A2|nr:MULTISPECIES: hypothetical protein [unclassified Tsukamurella]MDF0531370.1 hypothetical protein [Tsukamurella sp. 8J]MDF0588576.1 hypothetical protein [Tsukamurella sp. 8F]
MTARSLLTRLLFPANAPDPNRPTPRQIDGVTVFLRLQLQPHRTATDVRHVVAPLLAPDSTSLATLGASQVYLYSDATHRGLELAPFILGRTHTALTVISKIAGRPTPPKFSTHVAPAPAAMLEIQFDAPLTDAQHAAVDEIRAALAPLASNLSSDECDRRYIVVDSRASRPAAVFLTVLTRVPWNRTLDQAQHYWINNHAALVHDNLSRTNIVGYIQAHTTTDPNSKYDNEFGGVAPIEFDSFADYQRQGRRPASMGFNNTLCLDEMNLTIDSEIYLFHRTALLPETAD